MRGGTSRVLVLVLAAALPAACGFHPRGSVFSAGDPGRLFVDVDRGLSIEESLREALRDRAFVLVDDRDAADIVLRVSDERQTRRIVSVRSTGRVSEFELAHAVNMRIDRAPDEPSAAAGEGIGPGEDAAVADESAGEDALTANPAVPSPRTDAALPATSDRVVVTREYTYDESQVLGKENEARILRLEMSEELVRQVVLRTSASLAPRVAESDPLSPEGEGASAQ